MSLENVGVFYERLAKDEGLRTQIQGAKSKDECSQIVKNAGYNFTSQEFEEFTAQLLELDTNDGELQNLDEKELAAVFGGIRVVPIYGTPIIKRRRWNRKYLA
ncbi:Nif11-like leader peptide family natural product precursor [Nostoc sp. CHAB 5836]|uniref:Nif11-like leader peptide family natural product precursor n=1 Tax=Nostoc sp. CHAB 5836 TaxID=2780404 RepID=UPI001E2CF4E9|nr:Nif11-like leader peptide family natural product precursor [Nostoc sp. CHAB 5836]MCC5614780.1 Nif11-like leader peptide family natural product precursor [Nostoc sp. CHAB 5836]